MDRDWEREPYQDAPPEQVARIFAHAMPGRAVLAQRLLSGGRRNSHHAITLDDGSVWVLRLYAAADGRHQLEVALHALLAEHVPVPRIVAVGHEPGLCVQPFALLEFVAGETLDKLVLEGRSPPLTLFAELGRTLAAVHAHGQTRIGFFDATLALAAPMPALVDLYEPFVDNAAAGLGAVRATALLALVGRHADALAELDRTPALVHGDFRPANVLVHEGKLAAVLDWEFAMAGHPLADLGQFLRDEDEHAPGALDSLIAGYEQASGRALPENWRTLCRLRDLLNLLQMLAGSAERPRQHAEVLRLIDRTLRLES